MTGYYYTAEPIGRCSCHGCTCDGCDYCVEPNEPTLRDWTPPDPRDPWPEAS